MARCARYRPDRNESELLAEGFDQLYGVAVAPGGTIVAAELGAGRVLSIRAGVVEVLASGLNDPVGVAIAPDGACWSAKQAPGGWSSWTAPAPCWTACSGPRASSCTTGRSTSSTPGAKELIAFDRDSGTRRTIASELPVGAPPGVIPKPLLGMPPFSGPQGPFAGIAAGPDGTLYVSADAEGSVLALRRES